MNTLVVQRARHIPLAYLRGHAEFYGHEFTVNEHTLVPRPETETMIELLLALRPADGTAILDVGTGSGCIAITVALELPGTRVMGCDIDANCLGIAMRNADALGARVLFTESDLLTDTPPADIVVTNLPYVPNDFHINTAASHEPRHAIFGGSDGLNLYRTLFMQLAAAAIKPRYVLTESLPTQHTELAQLAKAAGFALGKTDDFILLFERA